VESSLSAAMAGNSLNLSTAGLNAANGDDFFEDDTPRSIMIEEQVTDRRLHFSFYFIYFFRPN
jgi:hypothetical protein